MPELKLQLALEEYLRDCMARGDILEDVMEVVDKITGDTMETWCQKNPI